MMRVISISLLAFLLITNTSSAQNQALCGKRTTVVSNLETKYKEVPQAVGLATNGTVIEVFISPKGSFTIMITAPNGTSCLVAAGHNWEFLKPKLVEKAI